MKKTTAAQASYHLIHREVLAGFSYKAAEDKAAHLAYLITAVNRDRLNGSVGFIAQSTHQESGKSLCFAIGRVLVQGNQATAMFTMESDQKTRKALSGLMVAGGRFLHAECSGRRSPHKSMVVTEAVTGVDGHDYVRILGGCNFIPVTGLIVTATLERTAHLNADTARRFLTVNLEGPVTAARNRDLIGHVMENRDELNAALRAIFDAGQVGGAAHTITSLHHNHNWGERVLGALSHVESEDGQTFAQLIGGRLNADLVNARRRELFSDAV